MIEINNLTNFAVDKKSFSQVAKIVLKGENRGTKTISLAFVGLSLTTIVVCQSRNYTEINIGSCRENSPGARGERQGPPIVKKLSASEQGAAREAIGRSRVQPGAYWRYNGLYAACLTAFEPVSTVKGQRE